MGCAQSGIGDESISRCKQRKLLLNQVLASHSSFAASHSAYFAALVSSGFALRRYAHGEAQIPPISTVALPELPVSIPRDDAVLEESVKLKARGIKVKQGVSEKNDAVLEHGVSKMDPVSIPKNDDVLKQPVKIWDFFSSMDTPEEEDEEEEDDDDGDEEVVFGSPDDVSIIEEVDEDDKEEALEVSFPAEARGSSDVNLFEALEEITDLFSKASECAQDVSSLLVPNRYRFRPNVADFRVTVDHAARVMRVITWNQPNDDGNRNSDSSAEGNEPHGVVLDKLLIWEKRLYDEVKASEFMKLKYQRQLVLLAQQQRCGASAESLEKTKAAVSHVHTRYIADLQLMDSAVSQVNILRDDQLYPKLVELVHGMANMWENMSKNHDSQLSIATNLKSLDITAVPGETTWDQYEKTTKLLTAVEGWQTQLNKLVADQKSYVSTLNSWLKLSLIPIRSSLKEKLSSSSRISNPPPIQLLLFSWQERITKLSNEPVKTAIPSFAVTLKAIILLQKEEMKLKDKYEETMKDYLQKNHALEEWLHKHKPSDDKDLVLDRVFSIESLKKRLEKEMEDHQKHCLRVRTISIRSLQKWLPEIFTAMSDYAHACVDTYKYIALYENPSNVDGNCS